MTQTTTEAPARLTIEHVRGRATITIDEVADLLSISRASAYAAARRGDQFPVLRMGRRLLVPVPRLLAWLGDR